MDNTIRMQKCEGHCDVVTYVDLNVVRNLLSGSFQKVSQAVVHELHQKNWQASIWILVQTKILDNVWVIYSVQELALLLESPDGKSVLTSSWHLFFCCGIKESFMNDFGGAR